ncbi:MAG: periplasmic heavy metal sensor [Deltaproteobacteria bacterium]|nr:periplasmic heavy metal sensor [Deltaproteobacteria bacterium]
MKKTIGIIGVIALIGIMVVPALAFGPDWGKGKRMGGWGNNSRADCPYGAALSGNNAGITDEKRTELSALYQKFYDDTAQIRSEISAKRTEMRTVWSTSEPDVERLRVLQKEINDLQYSVKQARLEFQLQAREIYPEIGIGSGFGRGACGFAKRGGPGVNQDNPGTCPRGFGSGRGPGGCWN